MFTPKENTAFIIYERIAYLCAAILILALCAIVLLRDAERPLVKNAPPHANNQQTNDTSHH